MMTLAGAPTAFADPFARLTSGSAGQPPLPRPTNSSREASTPISGRRITPYMLNIILALAGLVAGARWGQDRPNIR